MIHEVAGWFFLFFFLCIHLLCQPQTLSWEIDLFSDVTGAGIDLLAMNCFINYDKEKVLCYIQEIFGKYAVHICHVPSYFATTTQRPSVILPISMFASTSLLPVCERPLRICALGLEPGSHCRSKVGDLHDSMWVLWGCRTRSVSSEHTAIPFPFGWGCGPATPRDQSTAGWVTASQVDPSDTAWLWVTINAAQTINRTDRDWYLNLNNLGKR